MFKHLLSLIVEFILTRFGYAQCVYCREYVCVAHAYRTDYTDEHEFGVPLHSPMCVECACK